MNFKKNKIEIFAILFLVFALFAVIILTMEVNKYMPKPDNHLNKILDGRTGIQDSLYYNFPYYFTMELPEATWQFTELEQDTVLNYADYNAPILPQIKWFVQMESDSGGTVNAMSQTGILKWDTDIDPKELAINLLAETLKKYETGKYRAAILNKPTTPAHHVLFGTFWAIVLPEKSTEKLDVWVVSVLPRRNLTFVILSKTTKEDYPQNKTMFERIVNRFEALSMISKPVEWKF